MEFVTNLVPRRCYLGTVDADLVIVDWYTEIVRYYLSRKTTDAFQLAGLFIEEVLYRGCIPNRIMSDQEAPSTSMFWSKLCFRLTIKRRFKTAFQPPDPWPDRAPEPVADGRGSIENI